MDKVLANVIDFDEDLEGAKLWKVNGEDVTIGVAKM